MMRGIFRNKRIIGAIIIIAIIMTFVSIFFVINAKKEKKRTEIVREYPTINEILENEETIISIELVDLEGIYRIKEKEKIDEVIQILEETEFTPVIPKDNQNPMPTGPISDCASIRIFCRNDVTYSIDIDNKYCPSDFVIMRTDNDSQMSVGYYAKSEPIYRKIKYILFSGEKEKEPEL